LGIDAVSLSRQKQFQLFNQNIYKLFSGTKLN